MSNRIIFLDVDGPLIPTKMWVSRDDNTVYYPLNASGTKKMDTSFINTLNTACKMYGYKIVFNTAHNDFGKDYILAHAQDNQFDMSMIHDHCMTNYPTTCYSRMDAISQWLVDSAHRGQTVDHWIVIDDVFIADGVDHIRPSLYDGMTTNLIVQLIELMQKGSKRGS